MKYYIEWTALNGTDLIALVWEEDLLGKIEALFDSNAYGRTSLAIFVSRLKGINRFYVKHEDAELISQALQSEGISQYSIAIVK